MPKLPPKDDSQVETVTKRIQRAYRARQAFTLLASGTGWPDTKGDPGFLFELSKKNIQHLKKSLFPLTEAIRCTHLFH